MARQEQRNIDTAKQRNPDHYDRFSGTRDSYGAKMWSTFRSVKFSWKNSPANRQTINRWQEEDSKKKHILDLAENCIEMAMVWGKALIYRSTNSHAGIGKAPPQQQVEPVDPDSLGPLCHMRTLVLFLLGSSSYTLKRTSYLLISIRTTRPHSVSELLDLLD